MSNVLLTVLVVVTKSAVLVQSAKKVSLLENVVNHALQTVRVVVIKLMEFVIMDASLVSTQMGVTDLARVIVIRVNVYKALEIVWVNVKLDSMVTIATTLVQQIVILLHVIRSLAIAIQIVLLVSMATNAYKSALRIASTLVINKGLLVAHVQWDSMETSVIIPATKTAKMVVIV